MNKEDGSALIVTLMILLVMSMIGISSLSTATLEEKMAAFERNQKLAFQNAELSLTDAETTIMNDHWMEDLNSKIIANDSGYYGLGEYVNYYDRDNWNPGESCIAIANNQNGSEACYLVEHVTDEMSLEAGGGYGQISQSNLSHKILKLSANSTDSNGVARAMVQGTTRMAYIP